MREVDFELALMEGHDAKGGRDGSVLLGAELSTDPSLDIAYTRGLTRVKQVRSSGGAGPALCRDSTQ